MGKNERNEMYQAWKSANYRVDPNEVTQYNELKNVNNTNVGLNFVEGNIKGNIIISDYRDNRFNIGNNNLRIIFIR